MKGPERLRLRRLETRAAAQREARNLDWPGADEIAGRLAALVPPQAKGADPQIEAAKAQLGQLAQALAAAKAEIGALKQDRAHEARKLEIEAFEAETNRMLATGR